jgi:hypothetical protein
MIWNAENNAGGTEQQPAGSNQTPSTSEAQGAAHAAGTAHQFSSDEARVAGRKGGMAPHVRRGGVRRRTTGDGGATEGGTSQDGDMEMEHSEHGEDNR